MKKFDANKDGVIDLDEFNQFIFEAKIEAAKTVDERPEPRQWSRRESADESHLKSTKGRRNYHAQQQQHHSTTHTRRSSMAGGVFKKGEAAQATANAKMVHQNALDMAGEGFGYVSNSSAAISNAKQKLRLGEWGSSQ